MSTNQVPAFECDSNEADKNKKGNTTCLFFMIHGVINVLIIIIIIIITTKTEHYRHNAGTADVV